MKKLTKIIITKEEQHAMIKGLELLMVFEHFIEETTHRDICGDYVEECDINGEGYGSDTTQSLIELNRALSEPNEMIIIKNEE